MKLVIVGVQSKKMAKQLESLDKVTITKIKPPYVYFDYNDDIDVNKAISLVKKHLRLDRIIKQFVFEVYGFYNGKIDIASYLPEDKKKKSKYYQ